MPEEEVTPTTVEILLGLVGDERVTTLHTRYTGLLLSRLKRGNPEIETIPDELSYIVDELTIARFNRLGSEGLTAETMDGHSATYGSDMSLNAYENVIDAYLNPVSEHRLGKIIVW